MNAQETLAQIDHIMTEVDLEIYQWQDDLDMMSFIGIEVIVPMMLWTNDDPPLVVTLSNMEDTLINDRRGVRVMHHKDGEWGQIGTAEVDVYTGIIHMDITEDVPMLRDGVIGAAGFALTNHGPLRARPQMRAQTDQDDTIEWDIDNNIPLKDNPNWNPPFEGFENHPFFKES